MLALGTRAWDQMQIYMIGRMVSSSILSSPLSSVCFVLLIIITATLLLVYYILISYFHILFASFLLNSHYSGTYSWLQKRLSALRPENVGHVVFLHHHPYLATPFFLPDYIAMNERTLLFLSLISYIILFTILWSLLLYRSLSAISASTAPSFSYPFIQMIDGG